MALSDFRVFLIFLADRSRLALLLTSHLPSIKPELFSSMFLLNGSCVLLVEYFHVRDARTGPAHGERGVGETLRKGDISVSFPFFFLSSPAVNLVGFSVTFIREGDLVHLKRQMKELEANYQEIEKR